MGICQTTRLKYIQTIKEAKASQSDLVLFPELALTGYPPEDLLKIPHFIDEVEKQLSLIIEHTENITVVVGLPRRNLSGFGNLLYNSAAIIDHQKLLGFQDKILLPNYDVFNESRYFESGKETSIWEIKNKKIVMTICEDLWGCTDLIQETHYANCPLEQLKIAKPDLLLNLSASPFNLGKIADRIAVCQHAATSLNCPVFLCNQVGGNTSLIFDGHSIFMNRHGSLLHMGKGFQEDFMSIKVDENAPMAHYTPDPTAELYDALVLGLRDYFQKMSLKKACLGLSGGIDSAVVACLAVAALGKDNVLGIRMPSCYSSEGSLVDAEQLALHLEIDMLTIPITEPFEAYHSLLSPFFQNQMTGITEENLQARIRGMILMAVSNKYGHIVLSTGNKSEMAMGYTTLYGDLCGALAVIGDLTKSQVYLLADWINRNEKIIPLNTITKPPSAELKPNQKDSDTLPDYQIIDTVIEAYLEQQLSPEQIIECFGYDEKLVHSLITKIYRNEFKRRQGPPTLRISSKNFMTGRQVPIVQRWI